MRSKLPPDAISSLMQFVAKKVNNVKSPMNIAELCRQFKEETGTSATENNLKVRIHLNRQKIHKMDEFDMETKVKMIFALSAPIDAAFLVELKKVAVVEVDDQQRIITYKQKNGGLELNATQMKQAEPRNKGIIQLLAEKTKTVDTPISDTSFIREFKEKTGCSDTVATLTQRYLVLKKTIFKSPGYDKNTKIKMMFISNTILSDDILEELRQDADVEVDGRGKITKYKAKDGSLELNGMHGVKCFHDAIWERICQKANEDDNEKVDSKSELFNEQKYIDMIKFLIEKTKNATSPMSIYTISKEYKKEFKCKWPRYRITMRIQTIRQRIQRMNQFDMATRIRIMFALSATIDDDLLKELQNDAIVELDEKQRITKYEANDGSLKLEGGHYRPRGRPAKKRGRQSDQATTSLPARKSGRIDKRMSGGRKRARYPYSSSEESEDESPEEEKDDDEEPRMSENDAPMDSDGGDDFDYDPPSYHQDSGDGIDYDTPIHNKENLEHAPTEPIPEVTSDKKEEAGPSSLAKIETMSLLEFLNHFRAPILQFTPTLAPKIDEKIKKLEEEDQEIPSNIILESLDMCIQTLNTPDEMDSDEATISLPDFFYRLGMALLNIPHSSMDGFHFKIRKLATRGNKKVSLELIRHALEQTLDKLIL